MMHHFVLLAGVAAPFVAAHTTFTTLYIDDVTQGDGTCVRMNMNGANSSSPVPSLSSDDMACGSTGETAVEFTCPAAAGAKLTFEWRMWADLEQEGALDPSHKGPCAVYAKQVADMSSTAAAGPGWFKIFEQGYDNSTNKWCTEKLIDDGGLMSVQIPGGLPSGNYLFRPELLALHNANAGNPQFYTGCAQVQVQGTNEGTLEVPSDCSVSIPGYVKDGEASVSFNIYSPVFPYPMPGPSVYAGFPSSSFSTLDTSNVTAIIGATLVPSDYIIKEANWCGVEVADYSTEDGCWNGSEECYDQVAVCYASVPPTGNKNCKIFEAKCKGIQDACSAGTFDGPPNKGQKLVDGEVRTGIVVPLVDNLGTSGTDGGSSGSTGGVASSASSTATMAEATTAVVATATTTADASAQTTAETTVTSEYSTTTSATAPCGQKAHRHRRGGSRK